MQHLNILFFGSTHDSVSVLDGITNHPPEDLQISVAASVTQPPRPQGRKAILTPTPVETWAHEHNLPVHSFPSNPAKKTAYLDEQAVIDTLTQYDYDIVISASYGQLIPWTIIDRAEKKGLNIHPSLLPRWRGADPTPWTILAGDQECGVTIVGLSQSFDEGYIYAQERLSTPKQTSHEALRRDLFARGTQILCQHLSDIINNKNTGIPQHKEHATYARRLTREDGYIPWEILNKALNKRTVEKTDYPPLLSASLRHTLNKTEPSIQELLQRAVYALAPWPGLWTMIRIKNRSLRMKILSVSPSSTSEHIILENIQMEGSTPQPWMQIQELVEP
jgi:methionyl-tRNA formyltransferase